MVSIYRTPISCGRTHGRRQNGTGGKGLGLYLVKTLIEDFHGEVWIEDRVPGGYTQGTVFISRGAEGKKTPLFRVGVNSPLFITYLIQPVGI